MAVKSRFDDRFRRLFGNPKLGLLFGGSLYRKRDSCGSPVPKQIVAMGICRGTRLSKMGMLAVAVFRQDFFD
jgi:hypothetical protein